MENHQQQQQITNCSICTEHGEEREGRGEYMLGSHINYIHVKVKLYILFYIYFLAVIVVVTAAAAGCSVAMYKGHWKKLLIFFLRVVGLGLEGGGLDGWLVGWFGGGLVYILYNFFCTFHTLLPSSLVKKKII